MLQMAMGDRPRNRQARAGGRHGPPKALGATADNFKILDSPVRPMESCGQARAESRAAPTPGPRHPGSLPHPTRKRRARRDRQSPRCTAQGSSSKARPENRGHRSTMDQTAPA
ncbi:hypothetical protein Are01nite_64770 [Actinoplanes regularis]|nr:hypothetical protein Are01nite_64770 [Actinoplanes regularis]